MNAKTSNTKTSHNAPESSSQAVRVNRVSWQNNQLNQSDYDAVAIEQPLQIIVSDQVFTITMRTPGDDNALVAGLLFSEGIIKDKNDILGIESVEDNQIQVTLHQPLASNIDSAKRQLISHSSCGLCGKTSLKALELKNNIRLDETKHWLDPAVICQLPEKLKAVQNLFTQTGGVHGVASFNQHYQLTHHFEDIGRHNALDKVIGAQLMNSQAQNQTFGGKNILVLSGRVSFELMQKALMAGYPVCVAVGAPSSLAIEAAIRFDMTLIGFTKTDGFNIYSGQWRLARQIEYD